MVRALNVGFVSVLALGVFVERAFDTTSAVPPLDEPNGPLAELEDAFYHNPGDTELGLRLAAEYRARQEPELALAALRQFSPSAAALPAIQHEYALIYEDMGRLPAAAGADRAAIARCVRLLQYGSGGGTTYCSEGQLTRMELHLMAVEKLVKWGVADPRLEPERTREVYDSVYRTARLASVPSTPPDAQ